MSIAAALTLLAAAQAGPDAGARLLLCRPVVQGEPALARAEAVLAAARSHGSRFLDYGVPCEGEAEAVRAARRAGLALAVSSVAEGRSEGSRFVLVLSTTDGDRRLALRELGVAPGADPVPPLRRSLGELVEAVPRPPARVGPWVTVGVGAALLAAGGGLALAALAAADDRDRAQARGDWPAYVSRDADWRRGRKAAAVTAGLGAAVAGAGLAWRYAF